jgi:hypothetical protein
MSEMSTDDSIPLSMLPRELHKLTGMDWPGYRTCYNFAVSARIPATRGDNGRWTVARKDLPFIAKFVQSEALREASR